MSKLTEIEVVVEEQRKEEVCDPCASIRTGGDFSFVMNDVTGRIEKRFTDGHVETLLPQHGDPYDPLSYWD